MKRLHFRFSRRSRPALAATAGACSLWLACAGTAAGAEAAPVPTKAAPVSIDDLVGEALARNPEIQFYEAEIRAAKAGARSAGTWSNPELGGSIGRKSISGGDSPGDGVAWSVSLLQPIEWPGRAGLRKAIANRDVALAALGLERFRTVLAGKVRALAFDLGVAQQRAAAARVVAERLRELRDTLVARDPAGLTPLLEARVIEASSVKAEHAAAEAERDVGHLAIELNFWRGHPPVTPLRVFESAPRFAPAPALESLHSAALTNNFDLQVRAAELEQQGFKVALARHERFPSVSLGPVFSEEHAGSRERIVGLAVSVPLPLWQNNRAKVDLAEARRAQAEASWNAAMRELDRDLADHWRKYQHALGVLDKWRPDSIFHFQEAAELADRHYRLGAVPIATYVELQRQLVEAVEALLDARQEALAAAQRIEQLAGWRPLADFPHADSPAAREAP